MAANDAVNDQQPTTFDVEEQNILAPPDARENRRLPAIPGIDQRLLPLIFRPTDRPEEPLHTGLPFGPGARTLRIPREDDRRFRERLAQALLASGVATKAVQEFAQRLAEGR